MTFLDSLTSKWEAASTKSLLRTNALLCLFVLLAHGSGLILVLSGKAPEMHDAIGVAYVSVPAALLGLTFAVIGYVRSTSAPTALRVHAIILIALAAYLTYFGISSVLDDIPGSRSFVWNPILFAFVVGYPVYLLRRAFPETALGSEQFRYAPLAAVGASIVISAGIFWRMGVAT